MSDKQIAAQAYTYIAIDRGYFTDEGLEVELVPTSGGTDSTLQLVTGQVEFLDTALTASLLNAIARGVGARAIMSSARVMPGDRSTGIVVRQDLIDSGRYRTPEDLKGMKIAVQSPGGATWYVAQRALALGNVSTADIEFVILPFPDALAALAGKTVDAAFEVEPFISTGHDQGIAKLVVSTAEAAPGSAGPIVVVDEKYARNNPDLVRRFVTASLRGLRDYYRAVQLNEGSRDDVITSIVTHTAMKDRQKIEHIALSFVDPNGAIDVQSLAEMQAFFLDNGQQPKPVEISQFVDRSYLDYGLARLGHI
jgi:NitT/TauT family transport system substrate-binding protein